MSFSFRISVLSDFLRALLAACLVVLMSGNVLAQENTPAIYRIGTVSGQLDADDDFSPFEDYLESKLPGNRFQVTGFATIDDLMAAVKNRELDFAFTTPAALIELSLEQQLRILATITQEAGDTFSPWMAGAVFTRADRDDINTLSDVQGQKVVAVSDLALGGWLAAALEWQDLGVVPEEDFAELDYRFSYSAIMEAVCTGEMDVGVVAAAAMPTLRQRCPEAIKILPTPVNTQGIIYPLERSTRLYPEVAFVEVGNHDEEFIRRLSGALLTIEHYSQIAESVNVCGFTAPLLYDGVQLLMQELGLGPYNSPARPDIQQLLLDNITVVILTLLVILALISAGFINAHRLAVQVRASESYRKQLFEGSHIPMVVVDPDKMVYLDMNPAAVRQYGYTNKEELINMHLTRLASPNQDIDIPIEEAYRNVSQKVLESGEATFNWRHIRPGGEEWVARIHLMDFQSPTGRLIQATVMDITKQIEQEEERRKLEQQLAFSQRMESIGRLAGGIAHDFNNLLTIINGYCEVLLLEMPDSASGKILQQVRKAGMRASELTQQLLTFSRRQAIRYTPVDINNVISDAADMMRSVLGEDIRLQLKLAPGNSMVMTDPGQMQQVLLNLVVNAKDAMPGGGTLDITTREQILTPALAQGLDLKPGNYFQITITDTGIGMSPKIRQHIFEPFFTTKENAGTGLGLSTVYGIVKQSHGLIQVTSEEGKGSTFEVLLPQCEESEIAQPQAPEAALEIAPGAGCILVVEDQDDVRDYVSSVLRRAGYDVITANSGTAAMDIALHHRDKIHLLLTDVVMEGMSGGELAEKFSQYYPNVPILFTSGYPADELARYGVRQGIHQFLAKPFTPQDLLNRVDRIFKNAQAAIEAQSDIA